MRAVLAGVDYFVPDNVLNNAELSAVSTQWTPEKIESKTGIAERRVANAGQCSSDLAVAAAEKLFAREVCQRGDIDFLLVCTQSPDYFLPTTACLLQERLKLPVTCGALDFNLGCSGFVYGLGMAKGLIESRQATNVLLVTAETYSKFIKPDDLTVRTLFGDAAAATLIRAVPASEGADPLGPFIYGTDGRGAKHLMVAAGGLRTPCGQAGPGTPTLTMNGPEIFAFTITAVPKAVNQLLAKAELTLDDIDLVVPHQANEYMLEHLRAKMQIPKEKFYVSMRDIGNTVSSTIPIALRRAQQDERLRPGSRVLLVGFGVGLSWGATILRWAAAS